MNGFKPVKHDIKKQGETDWYYLDPRGAETVSDMQQINVANENAVNPKIKEIVAYDIQYNPGITDTTWTYFKKYFNEKNVDELAEQVHRIGVSEERNNEMRNKILSINRW